MKNFFKSEWSILLTAILLFGLTLLVYKSKAHAPVPGSDTIQIDCRAMTSK